MNCLIKTLTGFLSISISAIFFYQGETDSSSMNVASNWKTLFYRFANNFSFDIGNKDIPFIYAQLGKGLFVPKRYWGRISNMQRLIQLEHPEKYHMIYTKDITPYCPENSPHFCPDGYREIARRFVEKYNELQ